MDKILEFAIKGSKPWGFSLTGGKEQNADLLISKVETKGKAEKTGICVGDQILHINGIKVERREDAIQYIQKTGKRLRLCISRKIPSAMKKVPDAGQPQRSSPKQPNAVGDHSVGSQHRSSNRTSTVQTPVKALPTQSSPADNSQRSSHIRSRSTEFRERKKDRPSSTDLPPYIVRTSTPSPASNGSTQPRRMRVSRSASFMASPTHHSMSNSPVKSLYSSDADSAYHSTSPATDFNSPRGANPSDPREHSPASSDSTSSSSTVVLRTLQQNSPPRPLARPMSCAQQTNGFDKTPSSRPINVPKWESCTIGQSAADILRAKLNSPPQQMPNRRQSATLESSRMNPLGNRSTLATRPRFDLPIAARRSSEFNVMPTQSLPFHERSLSVDNTATSGGGFLRRGQRQPLSADILRQLDEMRGRNTSRGREIVDPRMHLRRIESEQQPSNLGRGFPMKSGRTTSSAQPGVMALRGPRTMVPVTSANQVPTGNVPMTIAEVPVATAQSSASTPKAPVTTPKAPLSKAVSVVHQRTFSNELENSPETGPETACSFLEQLPPPKSQDHVSGNPPALPPRMRGPPTAPKPVFDDDVFTELDNPDNEEGEATIPRSRYARELREKQAFILKANQLTTRTGRSPGSSATLPPTPSASQLSPKQRSSRQPPPVPPKSWKTNSAQRPPKVAYSLERGMTNPTYDCVPERRRLAGSEEVERASSSDSLSQSVNLVSPNESFHPDSYINVRPSVRRGFGGEYRRQSFTTSDCKTPPAPAPDVTPPPASVEADLNLVCESKSEVESASPPRPPHIPHENNTPVVSDQSEMEEDKKSLDVGPSNDLPLDEGTNDLGGSTSDLSEGPMVDWSLVVHGRQKSEEELTLDQKTSEVAERLADPTLSYAILEPNRSFDFYLNQALLPSESSQPRNEHEKKKRLSASSGYKSRDSSLTYSKEEDDETKRTLTSCIGARIKCKKQDRDCVREEYASVEETGREFRALLSSRGEEGLVSRLDRLSANLASVIKLICQLARRLAALDDKMNRLKRSLEPDRSPHPDLKRYSDQRTNLLQQMQEAQKIRTSVQNNQMTLSGTMRSCLSAEEMALFHQHTGDLARTLVRLQILEAEIKDDEDILELLEASMVDQ